MVWALRLFGNAMQSSEGANPMQTKLDRTGRKTDKWATRLWLDPWFFILSEFSPQ